MKMRRVVVIDVVGLSLEHFGHKDRMPNMASLLDGGRLLRMRPVFPPVTLPVQASLTTGAYPDEHGIVSNGIYFPEHFQVSFWEQSSSLVRAERIWDRLRRKAPGIRTAALFFQNTLYAGCDAVITPKPLHTDEGMVQWCYSKPAGLYEDICSSLGAFNLLHYWGPMASIESSRWIAEAAVEVMGRVQPQLMFVYLPHLDYCSQRHGPQGPAAMEELSRIDREVGRIIDGVEANGGADETVFMLLSEYAFYDVTRDIPVNRLLREKGLLKVRTIAGREYLDCELSPAFAMVDHQVAHVYIKPGQHDAVRNALERTEGIDLLLDAPARKDYRVGHVRSGDLIAVSAKDRWFSYYWWEDRKREPDFAARVDIHRKPGYDPLELFIEPGTFRIPQDTGLIKGSHGYPVLSERDYVPLVISGAGSEGLDIPEGLCMTDVAPLIERILIGPSL